MEFDGGVFVVVKVARGKEKCGCSYARVAERKV